MELLKQNLSVVFALLGVMIGALFSFVTMWITKNREIQLRLLEKVLDRRIDAHEKCLDLVVSLRSSTQVFGTFVDDNSGIQKILPLAANDGGLATIPLIFTSKTKYQEFHAIELKKVVERFTWLSVALKREVSFLLDYLVNLDQLLVSMPDENYDIAGILVKTDLIEMAGKMEVLINDFFTKELLSFKLVTLKQHHKYSKTETIARLNQTALHLNRGKIEELIKENFHSSQSQKL
jgi:hypothetical protein